MKPKLKCVEWAVLFNQLRKSKLPVLQNMLRISWQKWFWHCCLCCVSGEEKFFFCNNIQTGEQIYYTYKSTILPFRHLLLPFKQENCTGTEVVSVLKLFRYQDILQNIKQCKNSREEQMPGLWGKYSNYQILS